MAAGDSLKEQREVAVVPETNFFLPDLAKKFGKIVKVDESTGEIIKLGEAAGLQRTKKIHFAAARELKISREDLVFYMAEGTAERSGVARKDVLKKVDLGNFEIEPQNKEKVVDLHKKRAIVLETVLETEGIKEQLGWNY
ncbi:MAG: hypothetical protein ABID04_01445, partial [Patescibacteria group bacterium]